MNDEGNKKYKLAWCYERKSEILKGMEESECKGRKGNSWENKKTWKLLESSKRNT